MKEIKRVSAGVVFESDVFTFIDLLAAEQQRNRSFIINQIIRHYVRMTQQSQKEGAQAKLEPERPLSAISF